MTERLEVEMVFALPDGRHDPYQLSDAVVDAGYHDALVGTGNPRFLAVDLELVGDDGASVMTDAAQAILGKLPSG